MVHTSTQKTLAKRHVLLRTAGALSLSTLATASLAQSDSGSAGDSAMGLEEIIVTATRRAESQQDVAVSVTAVSGKDIQDLNIFKFEDVAALAPGLTLTGQSGFGAAAQLRGVGYDSNSSAAPSVDTYFNELPLDANYAFTSIYDVQQIEVVKGPQGTLRGRPSPGGAILLTTRRPDLDEFGGYVSASAASHKSMNTEAAFNAPLIDDKLALRVAGLYNDSAGTNIRSVSAGENNDQWTRSYRASFAFQPTTDVNLVLTHQYLKRSGDTYTQVEGPGVGYNGPAIRGADYLAVQESPTHLDQVAKITSLNGTWDLSGHRFTYIGGYEDLAFTALNDLDGQNAVLNYSPIQTVDSSYKSVTHELRFESTAADNFIDYTVGLWYQHNYTGTMLNQTSALSGAFGSPAAPSTSGPVDPNYVLTVDGSFPTDSLNRAVFANTVFHFSSRTDLSLGVRYLQDDMDRSQSLNISSGLAAVNVGLPPGFCAFVPGAASETYPGFCDFPVAASTFSLPSSTTNKEWVYNASLTQHLTDDAMAYLSYGHSFRPAGVTVAITTPVSPDLIFGSNETSDSFELGTKTEWLDGRLRFNAAVFYQKFDGYIGRFYAVPYQQSAFSVQSADFTYNGDATVKGVEFNVDAVIGDHWTVGLGVTKSEGEYDDARVPCRDTNGDGLEDSGPTPVFLGPVGTVLFCTSNAAISRQPEWSSTLQSEYSMPFGSVEGYIRGLFTYAPSNENVRPNFEAPAYGLLNVFLGVRGGSSAWDVGIWAKNVLDKQSIQDREPSSAFAGIFPTGYNNVRYTTEREIGATLRYSFGGG
jgi:iron complex outermembrane recepter protein